MNDFTARQPALFFDGDTAHAEQLAAILTAQSRVYLSVYILEGRLGQQYLKALHDKAQQGLDVRLIVDRFGSRRSMAQLKQLQAAGVKVRRFSLLKGRRNHRKLLLIDADTAFVGGMNICDHCCGELGWRDTQIRLHHNLQPLLASFVDQWCAVATNRVSDACLVRTGNPKTAHVVTAWLAALCAKAERTIWLHQGYFLPSREVLRILTDAVQRGVEVKVIVPEQSNLPLLTHAVRSGFPMLQAKGIKVFEYRGRMLHAKTITIDHQCVAVGSLNLDNRSCRHNDELMVVSNNQQVVQQMHAQLLVDALSMTQLPANHYKGVALGRQAAGRILRPLM